jgi:signal transduction histidine kinase
VHALARQVDLLSAVATQILVEGHLWGMIGVGSSHERPLPPDTEARPASFTELVVTAIANAESRAELAASRARIVAASDQSRRQIERDLHDGAQQRLVHAVIVLKLAARALSNADDHGTGLGGLADRVAAMDGRLVLDSPTGEGTRVCALLPLSDHG